MDDGRTVDSHDLVGAVDLLKKGRQRLPLTNVGNGPAKGQVKQFSFPEKGRMRPMSQVIIEYFLGAGEFKILLRQSFRF